MNEQTRNRSIFVLAGAPGSFWSVLGYGFQDEAAWQLLTSEILITADQ